MSSLVLAHIAHISTPTPSSASSLLLQLLAQLLVTLPILLLAVAGAVLSHLASRALEESRAILAARSATLEAGALLSIEVHDT
jgi:hypothetical protein